MTSIKMMAGQGLGLGRAFIVRTRVIQIVIKLLLLWLVKIIWCVFIECVAS